MAFELMPLPYPQDALAPAISAETLGYHHGKHHKAYIDKTNAAIAGTDLAEADLETVIAKARGSNQGLFNNAARRGDHGLEVGAFELGAGDRGVGLVDIGLVVLAVVEAQRFGRDRRGERFAVVRQRDEFECHGAVLRFLGVSIS